MQTLEEAKEWVVKYKDQRERFSHYMTNINEIDSALEIGANKATIVANGVLDRVRQKLVYN